MYKFYRSGNSANSCSALLKIEQLLALDMCLSKWTLICRKSVNLLQLLWLLIFCLIFCELCCLELLKVVYLKEITTCVRYVSFFNFSCYKRQIARLVAVQHRQTKVDCEKRINPTTVTLFPKWNTNTINFCHSFDCARGKESIIFFQ